MTGFLYLSARVHSSSQVERFATLSVVMMNTRLAQPRIASTSSCLQFWPGFKSR